MAVSRALRRLLRILTIEEEQCRLALESALGELRLFERALSETGNQARNGRRLVRASARSGELPDRLAGIEETHAADRRAAALAHPSPRFIFMRTRASLPRDFQAETCCRRSV